MGHDDSAPAKRDALDHFSRGLKKRGVFAEMSGVIAHIMLTRYNIPTVNNPQDVRRALKGKKIEWVGAHPSGKYKDNLGWYYRMIGSEKHMKILVRRPLI